MHQTFLKSILLSVKCISSSVESRAISTQEILLAFSFLESVYCGRVKTDVCYMLLHKSFTCCIGSLYIMRHLQLTASHILGFRATVYFKPFLTGQIGEKKKQTNQNNSTPEFLNENGQLRYCKSKRNFVGFWWWFLQFLLRQL